MIIRLKIKNFKSFNKETNFLLTPGKTRIHKDHIIKENSYKGINVLKNCAIYGANASGKSNFIQSLYFIRTIIKKGLNKIPPIQTFKHKLSKKSKNNPISIEIELKSNGKNYAYGFVVDENIFIEEWLYEIDKNNDTKIYYVNNKDNKWEFNYNFLIDTEQKELIDFTKKTTRKDQLFLKKCIDNNIIFLEPVNNVYDWFDNKLRIILPESKYKGLETNLKKDSDFKIIFTEFLKTFDSNIEGLDFKKVKSIDSLNLPRMVIDDIVNSMTNKDTITLKNYDEMTYLFDLDSKNNPEISRLITKHKSHDSKTLIDFELAEESQGTQRMLHLIPALISILSSEKVYVIDELERSLHPILAKDFINVFNDLTKGKESQIIFTTHETFYLDLSVLRRDEIFFCEKNEFGESDIYSLEEFSPRYDKDIRAGYIHGRYGAIPFAFYKGVSI